MAPGAGFSGKLGYLSVWNTALAPDAVQTFMNGPDQVSLPGLEANTTEHVTDGASSLTNSLIASWQDTEPNAAIARSVLVDHWKDSTGRYNAWFNSSSGVPPQWGCAGAPCAPCVRVHSPPRTLCAPTVPCYAVDSVTTCLSTQWLSKGVCTNCTVCGSSSSVLQACSNTSDTVCSAPGRPLGQYLVDTTTQVMAGASISALGTRDQRLRCSVFITRIPHALISPLLLQCR